MQVALSWGIASVLVSAVSNVGGPPVPFAEPGMPQTSAAVETTWGEPADSPQFWIAKRRQSPANPVQPESAPASRETTDQARPPSLGGNTIFEDDFEADSLRGWSSSGNTTATTTKGEHFHGQSAVMLKVGPSDPVNYRTEIVLGEKRGKMFLGKDYCIRFAFKTKDWSDFPRWITLFQTHAIPESGDFSCQAGRNSISLVSGSARNLALAVIDKPVSRRRAGAIAEVVHSQDLMMDHWYTVQLHYRPALGEGGIIEAWIDGKKVYAQSGGNLDPNDQCGRPSEPFTHLKLGLYKDRGNTGTQTVYFDDFSLTEGGECN